MFFHWHRITYRFIVSFVSHMKHFTVSQKNSNFYSFLAAKIRKVKNKGGVFWDQNHDQERKRSKLKLSILERAVMKHKNHYVDSRTYSYFLFQSHKGLCIFFSWCPPSSWSNYFIFMFIFFTDYKKKSLWSWMRMMIVSFHFKIKAHENPQSIS